MECYLEQFWNNIFGSEILPKSKNKNRKEQFVIMFSFFLGKSPKSLPPKFFNFYLPHLDSNLATFFKLIFWKFGQVLKILHHLMLNPYWVVSQWCNIPKLKKQFISWETIGTWWEQQKFKISHFPPSPLPPQRCIWMLIVSMHVLQKGITRLLVY